MAPPFYFSVEIMMQRPGIRERTDEYGRWLPPKKRGNNKTWPMPGLPTTPTYHFDGESTTLQQRPSGCRRYKVYSLYHNDRIFWMVNYDATKTKVGDGRDFPDSPVEVSDTESEEDAGDDWQEPSFKNLHSDERHLSYVGRRLPDRTLGYQRPGEHWATYLFPDSYQAASNYHTLVHGRSGLVGELPLLIGIAAMLFPLRGNWDVYNHLPHMIVSAHGRNWRIPQWITHNKGAGWFDKRGVVVKLYYDPTETTEDELKAYEIGQTGFIVT